MRDRALAVYRLRRCVPGAASMACAPRTFYRPTSPALAAVPALPALPSADDVNKQPTGVLVEMRRALTHTLADIEAALALRQAATPAVSASGSSEPLLDVEQAAKRLGVSKTWLYRHANALPFTVRLDGALRFDPHRLAAFLADRRRGRGASV
jgi:hypothetical protein